MSIFGMKSRKVTSLRLSILACVLLPCLSAEASSLPLLSNRYDDTIRSAVKHYWPDYPEWKYWKAQLYQESRFDPFAKSAVGAQGLAQFMPKTWEDITRQLGWSGISANQAEPAIAAGAFYMARLRITWRKNRSGLEQNRLAQAAYNSGTGNILRAQSICNNARLWIDISPCLSRVTGQSANETLTYVQRIEQWRQQLGD